MTISIANSPSSTKGLVAERIECCSRARQIRRSTPLSAILFLASFYAFTSSFWERKSPACRHLAENSNARAVREGRGLNYFRMMRSPSHQGQGSLLFSTHTCGARLRGPVSTGPARADRFPGSNLSSLVLPRSRSQGGRRDGEGL